MHGLTVQFAPVDQSRFIVLSGGKWPDKKPKESKP